MALRYCVNTSLCPNSSAATRKLTASLVLFLISSNFIVFSFSAGVGLFFLSLERQREKTRRHWGKGQNGVGGRVAGREGERGECQTLLFHVWRETGAVETPRPSRGQAASTRKRA